MPTTACSSGDSRSRAAITAPARSHEAMLQAPTLRLPTHVNVHGEGSLTAPTEGPEADTCSVRLTRRTTSPT